MVIVCIIFIMYKLGLFAVCWTYIPSLFSLSSWTSSLLLWAALLFPPLVLFFVVFPSFPPLSLKPQHASGLAPTLSLNQFKVINVVYSAELVCIPLVWLTVRTSTCHGCVCIPFLSLLLFKRVYEWMFYFLVYPCSTLFSLTPSPCTTNYSHISFAIPLPLHSQLIHTGFSTIPSSSPL